MTDEYKTKTRAELQAELRQFRKELEQYSKDTFHYALPSGCTEPLATSAQDVVVRFKRLHPDAVLPTYAHPGDACMDLVAVDIPEKYYLPPWFYRLGFAMEIPEGYVALIFPRSSIVKTMQTMANCVAVIDSNYRGEVVLAFCPNGVQIEDLADKGRDYGNYRKGEKIAQMMILPLPKVVPVWADALSETDRGDGGFGSTGR